MSYVIRHEFHSIGRTLKYLAYVYTFDWDFLFGMLRRKRCEMNDGCYAVIGIMEIKKIVNGKVESSVSKDCHVMSILIVYGFIHTKVCLISRVKTKNP